MIRLFIFMIFIISNAVYAQDNEIYVEQSGANANINLEQLGTGNLITGLQGVAGTPTAMQLSGTSLNLDIFQVGTGNKFLADVTANSFTGLFNFVGSSNEFTLQVDPTNTYGADSSDQNIAVTGTSNTFTLNQGTAALADSLDLDWVIQGTGNEITSSIDIDAATNYVDIDGDDNALTYDGDGVTASAGGYFKLEQTGDNRTFNIQQQSSTYNDWLQIDSTGDNGTVCVIQNDNGTTTSC